MKKSNKIVIAFAAALILIPLLGMIYESQVNYKVGTYDERDSAARNYEDRFNTPSEHMASTSLAPFTSINIENGEEVDLYIKFIKDDKFGVKVNDEVKNAVSFKVDANGRLQISIKATAGKKENIYSKILIYGPAFTEFNAAKVGHIWLDATADSLAVNVKNSQSISLNQKLKLNVLRLTANQVKELGASDVNIKSLMLNLTHTNFNVQRSSFDHLAIQSSGQSDIEIEGSDRDKSYFIRNLIVNKLGAGDFKLQNIKVDQCSGSFSDQTNIEMPAVNLNQMYKK